MPRTGHGAGYRKKASQAHPGSNPQPLAGWCWELVTPWDYHFSSKTGTLIPAFPGILISNNDWTEVAEGTEGAEHVPLDAWPLADMPPLPLFLTPFMQQTCKWASLCQAPHPTLGVQGRVRLAHFLRPRSSQSAIYNSPLLQAFQPTDWALLISFL